jgi:hypothetical protein
LCSFENAGSGSNWCGVAWTRMRAVCVTNIHRVELSYLGLAGLEFHMNLHKLSLNNPLGSDNYVKNGGVPTLNTTRNLC